MKTNSNALAVELAGLAIAPPTAEAATRLVSEPQPQPAESVADNEPSRVAAETRKRYGWAAALSLMGLLLASNLAATLINHHRMPTIASYNSRVADLDQKLSRELAGQLRAAGFVFDAAIVNVESPACQRAVCLLKFLRREGHDSAVTVLGGFLVRQTGKGLWSFTGTGELAALKFSVDASAEMRRLAEATPPEFPQAAVAAMAPDQSPPDNLSAFSEQIEILLPAVGQRPLRHWLDLDTGRCLTEPDLDHFVSLPSSWQDWLRSNNLDLCAVVYRDGSYCFYASQMAVAPVDGQVWEQATPEQILSQPALRLISHSKRTAICPARGEMETYIFRTEQGTFGILQALGLDSSLRQLKLRYKVARGAAKADA